MIDPLSVVVGATLGVLLTTARYSLSYLRRNPTLPPREGHVVVTRRDGSQHYRRKRAAETITDADYQQPSMASVTMQRSEFAKLSPADRASYVVKGGTIIDDAQPAV